MGVRDLFFSIKAKDETSAAFSKVKNNLRTVDGMVATSGQRLQRWGRGMMGFGAIATAGMAPLMFAFRDSLALYDEQERAQAKIKQAIKSTGGAAGFTADELFRHASALQSLTRFGDEQILGGVTAQLLTFTNIADEQFMRAQTSALDLATTLNGDIQSAAIMVGKALNDPVLGLTAMSRAGVTFAKDQQEVIKALAKTGDIAGAQNLILAELEKQYGGQAKAAAEAGLGAMDQLRNSWGDLKEEVGAVIASVLPPMVDFFKKFVDGFKSLPEGTQKFAVTLGVLTAAAGPATLALGALVAAAGAISGPIWLAVAAGGALVGLLAALWPEVDNTTSATDNLVGAIGDEITQSQLLSRTLGTANTMSVDAAQKKLAEAKARHENVAAIIAEHRALALGSTEWSSLTTQIEQHQAALNSIGFPAIDAATTRNAAAFEEAQQALADLITQRQRLLDSDQEVVEQLERTEENIRVLEAALADASGGVVTFGDALITPIEPGNRLANTVSGISSAAEEVTGTLTGLGTETSGLLKDVFADGRVEMNDFADFAEAWGTRFLGRMLDKVFDPLGKALDDMIASAFQTPAQVGSGGGGLNLGGLFGGMVQGVGDFFGNLLGFDTQGEMAVSGRNGIDRNVVSFKASADENIKVVKRGNPDSGRPVVVHIHTPDPAAFRASRGQVSAQIARAVGHGARFT